MVAENRDSKILVKAFHSEIQPDWERGRESNSMELELPIVRNLEAYAVQDNFNKIKRDIEKIVLRQMERMEKSPVLSKLIIKKNEGKTKLREKR